jgi:hypothetical protein
MKGKGLLPRICSRSRDRRAWEALKAAKHAVDAQLTALEGWSAAAAVPLRQRMSEVDEAEVAQRFDQLVLNYPTLARDISAAHGAVDAKRIQCQAHQVSLGKLTQLESWHAAAAAPALRARCRPALSVVPTTEGQFDALLRDLPALARDIEAAHAPVAVKKAQCQKLRTTTHAAAFDKLAELVRWGVAGPLSGRDRTLVAAEVAGRFDDVIRDLPTLATDITAAHTTATQKRVCDAEWARAAAVHTAAQAVRATAPPALVAARVAMNAAYLSYTTAYTAANYLGAVDHPKTVKAQGELLLLAANRSVIEADLRKPPAINADQDARAAARLAPENTTLTAEQKEAFKALEAAAGPAEKPQLRKALAAGHMVAEIEAFAARIRGKDEAWMRDNLRLTASSSGKGVTQQFFMSCSATTVQALKGERDPIYALELHDRNIAVSGIGPASQRFAQEQKTMLESTTPPEWAEFDSAAHTAATAVWGRYTKADQNTLNGYINAAATQHEKNLILARIGTGASVMAVRDYATSIRGQRVPGGTAVARRGAAAGAPHGAGRIIDDLLNQTRDVTGIEYEGVAVDAATTAAAVDAMATHLKSARPVPLHVSNPGDDGGHFVLVTAVFDGPPRTFSIHDPWTGDSVAQTDEQLKQGKLTLPSGWGMITTVYTPK